MTAPKCYKPNETPYCFARTKGLCEILNDTNFKKRGFCPFYKTKDEYKEDLAKYGGEVEEKKGKRK